MKTLSNPSNNNNNKNNNIVNITIPRPKNVIIAEVYCYNKQHIMCYNV